MKTKRNTGRVAAVVALFTLAVALVACGGGGGGSAVVTPPVTCTLPQVLQNGVCVTPTPVDTTAPVLTVTTSSPAALTSTIKVGANEDLGGVYSVTVKNGATTIPGNTTLDAGNRGLTWTASAALPCNVALSVSGSATDVAGNSASIAGTVTTVACPDTALHYPITGVAVWEGGGYPFVSTKTSAVKATNSTTYTIGFLPLFNCGLPNKVLSDGYIPIKCTAAVDSQQHVVKLDPTTGVLTNFIGTLPPDVTFTFVESNSTQPVINTTSARLADGWLYAETVQRQTLLFQADAGGTTTVRSGIVGSVDTIKIIRSYSN